MSLEYFLLDEDQDKPPLDVSYPVKHGILIRNAFTLDEIRKYFTDLMKLPWRVQEIQVAGKSYMPKRETLGFAADEAPELLKNRSFYGITYPQIIYKIRDHVSDIIASNVVDLDKPDLNFCWGNRYRTGDDKVGRHKDNEKWHSEVDPIVSVSFGEYRHFDILDDYKRIHRVDLGYGDIFLMLPGFQDEYFHAVPVQKKIRSPRVNLTYRSLEAPPDLS